MSAPDLSKIERFRALVAAGHTFLQASASMGVSRSTLYFWADKHGIPLPQAGTVQARRRKLRVEPVPPSAGDSREHGLLPQGERTILLAHEAKDLVDDLIAADISDEVARAALMRVIDTLADALDPEVTDA